jgi:nucleotide-binding universal stress UspA family protein
MKLLKTILVAVDFDETTEHLLTAVAKFSKPFDSEVVLLHAIEPVEHGAYRKDGLEAAIKARLQEMGARLSNEGVAVSALLCPHGKATSEIVAASEQRDAKVIMIGARGVAADDQFALGTTTEKVIRTALKPVLAVHPTKPFDLSHIVCPVDCSDASTCGLSNVIRLARAFHSHVHVLTVIRPPGRYHRLDQSWARWAIQAEVQATKEATQDLNNFLEPFDLRSVTWDKRVERGEPAERIVAAVQSLDAGLVVMGSTGRRGLPYLLMGSTVVKVARHMPCSLLTVKRDQMLKLEVERNIADINEAFREGRELLAAGFRHEALERFDRCLGLDPHFAHAIDAKADAYERLGQSERAQEYHKVADMIRRELWDRQVEASVRASHPLFRHQRSF